MEKLYPCPNCHIEVRQTDYFCFNCGRNLKPKPPTSNFSNQLILYLKSFFLPPIGIILAIPYFKQKDIKSKIIGGVAVVITFISILIVIKATLGLVDMVQTQVSNQLQFQGY